jgi:hypothetical protein
LELSVLESGLSEKLGFTGFCCGFGGGGVGGGGGGEARACGVDCGMAKWYGTERTVSGA